MLKRLIVWFATTCVALVVILMVSMHVLCDPSGAAAQARALDPQQLEAMHLVLSLLDASRNQGEVLRRDDASMPLELSKIGAQGLVLDDHAPRAYLAGCMDDKAYLWFFGLRSGEKRIELAPGERLDREVLWRSESAEQSIQ